LSKDEVDTMVKEASAHADEDKKHKEQIEKHNHAESLAYSTEKALKELGDKVNEEQRKEVNAKLEKLREALKGSDDAAVDKAAEDLATSFHELSKKLYEGKGPAAGAEGAGKAGEEKGEDKGKDGKDGVVDAEYEVVDEKKDK
jgi:molecular chaperone DnaK